MVPKVFTLSTAPSPSRQTSSTSIMVQLLQAIALLALAGSSFGDAVVDLQNKGRPAIDALLAKSKTCTKENLMVRKEW
jgi:hypothetical protein